MIHGSLLKEDWCRLGERRFGLKSWLLLNAGQQKAQWYFLLLSDMWAHGDKNVHFSRCVEFSEGKVSEHCLHQK